MNLYFFRPGFAGIVLLMGFQFLAALYWDTVHSIGNSTWQSRTGTAPVFPNFQKAPSVGFQIFNKPTISQRPIWKDRVTCHSLSRCSQQSWNAMGWGFQELNWSCMNLVVSRWETRCRSVYRTPTLQRVAGALLSGEPGVQVEGRNVWYIALYDALHCIVMHWPTSSDQGAALGLAAASLVLWEGRILSANLQMCVYALHSWRNCVVSWSKNIHLPLYFFDLEVEALMTFRPKWNCQAETLLDLNALDRLFGKPLKRLLDQWDMGRGMSVLIHSRCRLLGAPNRWYIKYC